MHTHTFRQIFFYRKRPRRRRRRLWHSGMWCEGLTASVVLVKPGTAHTHMSYGCTTCIAHTHTRAHQTAHTTPVLFVAWCGVCGTTHTQRTTARPPKISNGLPILRRQQRQQQHSLQRTTNVRPNVLCCGPIADKSPRVIIIPRAPHHHITPHHTPQQRRQRRRGTQSYDSKAVLAF